MPESTVQAKASRFRWHWVIIIAALTTVLSYHFLSGDFTDTPAADSSTLKAEPTIGVAASPVTSELVTNTTIEVDVEPYVEAWPTETETDLDQSHESENEARRQQLQYLQEVLPHTLMIPTEKTEAEIDQMMAELEQHRTLQQRIDENSATLDERFEYVELHRRKLEEEKELIQLCENEAANSLASAAEQNAQLCTHMAESATERLRIIEELLLELDDILLAAELN